MLKQTRMFGLICILASGAASAQLTATSTISNFSYELIDLNPNDGVAASLSWQALAPEGHRSNSMAYVLGNTPGEPGYASEYEDGTRPLEAVSASTATPRGSASASVIGELGKEVTLHTSVASVYEPGADDFLRWTAEASTGWMQFILSPNTAVIFSADISGGGTPGAYNNFSDGGLWARTDLEGDWDEVSDQARWSTGPSYQQRLRLTVSNTYTYSTTNGLVADVRSIAFNTLSPVPEPSTWMMLIAGVGIAGVASRRASRTSLRNAAFFRTCSDTHAQPSP